METETSPEIAGRIMPDTRPTSHTWDRQVCAIGHKLKETANILTHTSQDFEGLNALQYTLQNLLNTVNVLIETAGE